MLAIVFFFGMVLVFGVPFQMLGMPSEGAVICGTIGAVCCVAWIITKLTQFLVEANAPAHATVQKR